MSEEVVSLLQKMIRINTVSPPGNEKDLAVFLEAYLKEKGLKPCVQSVEDNRANLICEIGSGDETLLVLNGHLDVVPAQGEWKFDPFAGNSDGTYVYGRGAADMKGGLAALTCAFLSVIPYADKLKGKLRLVFVADEETSNHGSLYYLAHDKKRYSKNYAVIAEPTELRVCKGHLGAERYWISFKGSGAHSSKPENGCNAIYLASKMINALEQYHIELRKRSSSYGSPSCAVTRIEGGEKDNTVPSSCKLFIDRRTVPGETKKDIDNEIDIIIKNVFGKEKDRVEVSSFFDFSAGRIGEDNPLIVTACEIAKRRRGEEFGKPIIFGAGCEQAIFTNGGFDTIVWGPGSLSQAHVPNERIPIEEVTEAKKLYEELIFKMLR
ncbi:M20 family metallopeptidase [Treponema parvum]|uniref:Probable succinyl-diaminopimelate desuccinylase n=1 Tax=Treponema parvum TaxID=138851 RepID=A0A975F586_9SPIR|nr:M20 family metallopeptidase [Treponema parvum]QTQ14543.1 M20 family metallopeptidase [Treponema parvum]